MKQNTGSWDIIIIYTLVQKLDNKTKKGMRTSYSQQGVANLTAAIYLSGTSM
jgi:hypothetical protein